LPEFWLGLPGIFEQVVACQRFHIFVQGPLEVAHSDGGNFVAVCQKSTSAAFRPYALIRRQCFFVAVSCAQYICLLQSKDDVSRKLMEQFTHQPESFIGLPLPSQEKG
jgi:hypothetical protein